MVTRACISINNRCNLNCSYCHFQEKKDFIQEDNMDVITILDNIILHIEKNNINLFKLGFVGNGEPLLDYEKLNQYIVHIGSYLKSGRIAAYTITNGILIDSNRLEFFKEYTHHRMYAWYLAYFTHKDIKYATSLYLKFFILC